jgi:hypothetical protein
MSHHLRQTQKQRLALHAEPFEKTFANPKKNCPPIASPMRWRREKRVKRRQAAGSKQFFF